MKTGKKYDFVGHITYPYTDESKQFFFKQSVSRRVKIIKRNGEEIANYRSNITSGTDLANFLNEFGYEVEEKVLENQTSHLSIRKVLIPCNNLECRHAAECVDNHCTIKIKAGVEKIRRSGKHSKVLETNIIVSYGAGDISELSTKSECLLWHINDILGLQGEADIYGKMEMC